MRDNRASGRKSKVLLADIEVLKKNEIQRRRALRLLQVRQQWKDIASQLREKCKDERNKQAHLCNLEWKEDMREKGVIRQTLLQQQYHNCLSSIGQSHRDAAAQPNPEVIITEERERWRKVADKRGEVAAKWSRSQISENVKKQQDAEKQRNFVRAVENLRSSVVASLPKKVSLSPDKGAQATLILREQDDAENQCSFVCTADNVRSSTVNSSLTKAPQSPERGKRKEKQAKKVTLHDVNKVSDSIHLPHRPIVLTHVDVSPQQDVASGSNLSLSVTSAAKRPPCIEKFVNKLESGLGTHGSTSNGCSANVSQISKSRTKQQSSCMSLDIIEEERIEGENRQEIKENNSIEANTQMEVDVEERTALHSNIEEAEFMSIIEYSSEEIQTTTSCSEDRFNRVQLYDHTHRFKHDYDATNSISVTRLIQNNENDARTEAAIVESTGGAAINETTIHGVDRGRDALRRARLERQYQNLMDTLGSLSREERISRAVAGIGHPVEAHISDARLKKHRTDRQIVIAAAFENVIGCSLNPLPSLAPSIPSPSLDVHIQPQTRALMLEPITGNGANITVKETVADSPAAALNVGTWASLPVTSSGQSPAAQTSSPKPSIPSSADSSIVLVPPPPPMPLKLLSPWREAAQRTGEQSTESKEEQSSETKPVHRAEKIEQPASPTICDLDELRELLERVRLQRERLLASRSPETAPLPPLPPSPSPQTADGPTDAAGNGDTADLEPPLPPPPPSFPLRARSRHSRHRSHKHRRDRLTVSGADVDGGQDPTTDAPLPQQPSQTERKSCRRGEDQRSDRDRHQPSTAEASPSAPPPAHEVSVDVSLHSEPPVCTCRPRDADAMRLHVSVTEGSGAGGDDMDDCRRHRSRHHHRRRHPRHSNRRYETHTPCGRRSCPHRLPSSSCSPTSLSREIGRPRWSPHQSSATSPTTSPSQNSSPSRRLSPSSRLSPQRSPPRTPEQHSPQASRATLKPLEKVPSKPPPRVASQKATLPRKARSPIRSVKGGSTGATHRTQPVVPTDIAPPGKPDAPRNSCWHHLLTCSPPQRTEDSASTLYLSPPDRLQAQASADLESLVSELRRQVVTSTRTTDREGPGSTVPPPPAPLDPLLERYILKLLAMSKASVEALNVSSSDVSVHSDVVQHPSNVCHEGIATKTVVPDGATRQTLASVPGATTKPHPRRSVAVSVTPEQLSTPCAPCAPCTYPVPLPCVCVPKPPPYGSRPHSPSGMSPASGHTENSAANSSGAPLDATEYLQHDLFTRMTFQRVPASVPPADPALPHDSPDYRTLPPVKSAPPLRVGGGALTGDTTSTVSQGSTPLTAPITLNEGDRRDVVWRTTAANVAELSERCARRIQSLARLIEHVRQEKEHLAHLQNTSHDSPTRSPSAHCPRKAHSPAPTDKRNLPQQVASAPIELTDAGTSRKENWHHILYRKNRTPAGRLPESPPPSPHSDPTQRPGCNPQPVCLPTCPDSVHGQSSLATHSPPKSLVQICPGHGITSPQSDCPHTLSPSKQDPSASLPTGDDAPLWLFTPDEWPHASAPCNAPIAAERSRNVLRPKPPPAAWRPGVPYVEQHELSAIPEADMSHSVVVGEESAYRIPSPAPEASTPLLRGMDESPSVVHGAGPREVLHELLMATHRAAQHVQPWTPAARLASPPTTLTVSPPFTLSPRTMPPSTLHCEEPLPPSRIMSPCSPSPRALSPHAPSPHVLSPHAPSPRTFSPRVCSPVQRRPGTTDEDDPDIVEELMKRGVLRSPFSWMKSAGSDVRTNEVDIDLDMSLLSGASSDFVSDLMLSASSSTPRRAPFSSAAASDHARQRGGAEQSLVTSKQPATIQRIADELFHFPSDGCGTGSDALPEDLEAMFQRLGLGWAAAMLRKTQEAMAISSSSSEASRGATRPGAGGTVCGSALQRGHSTPANASGVSDASNSISWTRGQVAFTGDSDMSSVPGASSRDISTPNMSLTVKSKNKNDSQS